MLGRRGARQFELGLGELLVPESPPRRLLQRIAALVDFEPLRAQAAPYFHPHRGRPSMDPVVMVKMMLLGYLFGIPSDRQLVDECGDRLSFREFLGYNLSEALPTHANFTQWRQRLGPQFFRDWLHEIVRQCVAQGLAVSRARTVDATTVKAQAALDGPLLRVPTGAELEAYLQAHFAGDPPPPLPEGATTRLVNRHDPEARLQAKPGELRGFGYQASVSADAPTGLICDATATPTEQPGTAVEHVDQDPLGVEELVADGRYDDGDTLAQLQARGVQAYVPETNHDQAGQFSKQQFTYEADTDSYLCPAGQRLAHARYDAGKRQHFYLARAADCQACRWRAQCTRARRRTVTRRDTEWARAQTVRAGPRYEQWQRCRRIQEHLHHLGKRDHGLRRARGLGLAALRIQVALTAVAINLRKLVRWLAAGLGPEGGGGAGPRDRRVSAPAGATTARWPALRPRPGARPAPWALATPPNP